MADTSWNSVTLLLPCEEADESTTFTDYSPRVKTVTANGGAALETDVSPPYGASSCFLDGNGDYLSLASGLINTSSDFTIEGWIYLTDNTGNQTLFSQYNSSDTYRTLFDIRSGKLSIFNGANGTTSGSTTIGTGAWKHIAYVRQGTTVKGYLDGALELTASAFNAPPDRPFWIGSYSLSAGADDFTGYIKDIRVTNVARYTTTFSTPTTFYPQGADGTAAGIATSAAVGAEIGTIARTVSAVGTSTATAVGSALASSVCASAGTATVSGVGYSSVSVSAPFAVNNLILVSIGCPFHLNLEAAVATISCPFHAGTYTKTISVPFHVNIPTAVATITCPFYVYGDLSTEAAADFIHWKPKVVLDGTDISAKLIGALEIESEEMAAPIASFSFIPAAGSVDPLAWVGKTVTISWQRYVGGVLTNTALRFTGVVSDPSWDADERILSISATSDLQGRLDRLTKAQIDTLLASVSPTYSEYIFGPAEDMSGYEYAQALISTTDAVLWQDQAAVIHATSTATKVTADYTFGTDDIIAGSLGDSPHYPSRAELVNKLDIVFEYRFQRRRQRHITCVFRSVDLDTPSTYLSGNLGGWELPQRTQVASAADSGGWVVIGDITYTDVWPSGYYSTYSDSGVPMMEGWSNTPAVTDEQCIGAQWTAARRWLQTVTETATLTVQSTESQAVVGVLADNESYSIDDEATDEEWESSLEYDDYATGAVLMSNAVDKRLDLDELRDEFEDAQEVAISKARNDILRAHRGTTVTFSAPFLPALNLSHTVAIDTTYLDCQGKVRRITDTWNLDTGECLSTVDVALFRHNGAGLVTDTPVAAVEKAADPTETEPRTRLNLSLYIGGQDDRPKWSVVENESGYFVNLPFNANDGSSVITGGWNRNPLNPDVAPRIYEEGFSMTYPNVDAEYANPSSAASTATFEVAIPEDSLTLISG